MISLEIIGLIGSIASIIGILFSIASIIISVYCYQHYYNKSINSYKKFCKKIDKRTVTKDDEVTVRLALKDATYLEIVELSSWLDKKKNKTGLDCKLLEWINHELKARINN